VRRRLSEWAELARDLQDVDAFSQRVERELHAHGDDDTAASYIQAAPPDQLYLGLARYWRKRAERETVAA